VKIHAGGQEHLLRETLKNFEERLDKDASARASVGDRQRRLYPAARALVPRRVCVVLRDGTKLMSSRTYSERLRKIIQ